jgi:hypothetical protein
MKERIRCLVHNLPNSTWYACKKAKGMSEFEPPILMRTHFDRKKFNFFSSSLIFEA